MDLVRSTDDVFKRELPSRMKNGLTPLDNLVTQESPERWSGRSRRPLGRWFLRELPEQVDDVLGRAEARASLGPADSHADRYGVGGHHGEEILVGGIVTDRHDQLERSF